MKYQFLLDLKRNYTIQFWNISEKLLVPNFVMTIKMTIYKLLKKSTIIHCRISYKKLIFEDFNKFRAGDRQI